MFKKAVKILVALLASAILVVSLFLYFIFTQADKELEQEKTSIMSLLNNETVIIEHTGLVTEVIREITQTSENTEQAREKIMFSGIKGEAVIEGIRTSNDGMILIDGTISFNGNKHNMHFEYPDGLTEINLDFDIEI